MYMLVNKANVGYLDLGHSGFDFFWIVAKFFFISVWYRRWILSYVRHRRWGGGGAESAINLEAAFIKLPPNPILLFHICLQSAQEIFT